MRMAKNHIIIGHFVVMVFFLYLVLGFYQKSLQLERLFNGVFVFIIFALMEVIKDVDKILGK